ncbi:MAG: helix-turn-helix domain-containing protein [Chloroflexota bacterium]|nr:helix-turn-helix domain-containing protein [Chloroflexota bacterium]
MQYANQLLRVREVSARLGLHPHSVRKLIKTGRLRSTKTPGMWLVPESAVTEFASGQARRA